MRSLKASICATLFALDAGTAGVSAADDQDRIVAGFDGIRVGHRWSLA